MSLSLLKTFCINFIVTIILSGQAGIAADVAVRSGEHADFSRIVLYFKGGESWEFGRVDGGFEFRGSNNEASFLLGRVFEWIPRTRISEIKDLGNGRLFFAVDCECHGDVFNLPGGQVVLDIKDGASRPNTDPFNQPLVSLEQEATFIDSEEGSVEILPGPVDSLETPESLMDARLGLPLIFTATRLFVGEVKAVDSGLEPELSHEELRLSFDEQPLIVDTVPAEGRHIEPSDTATFAQRVANVEMQLLEQIGRAATQGLLEPSLASPLDQIEVILNAGTITAPETTSPVATPTEPEEKPVDPYAHMNVVTAIDIALGDSAPNVGLTPEGKNCLPDSFFNISDWGPDITNGGYLGTLRSELFGEFDVVNPTAVQSLAERYIFLTFGAEAIELITRLGPDLDQANILTVMAEIVDNKYSGTGLAWAQYLECNGSVALWSALAQESLNDTQAINGQAISAAFSKLPLHLRRYLGPTLAARLIEAGEVETANSLRNAIDRVAGEPGDGVSFLNAQFAIEQHRPLAAIEAFQRIIAGDTELAPKAIQDLIEYKIAQGVEVTEDEISVLSTYAFENRGSDIGRDLARTEIVALANTARFAETFSRLELFKAQEEVSVNSENEILWGILDNLVEKGQDAVFLRYINSLPVNIHIPIDLRLKLAERLNGLGFQQVAREILGRTAQVPNTLERRLFTEIALAEQKFDVALGYLAGLEENADILLRAKAQAGKHNLLEAAQLFEQAGDSERHLQAAWRAGNWEEVAEIDSGTLGQASQMMLSGVFNSPSPEDQSGVFSKNFELLEESLQARNIISQLLGELPVN